MFTSIKPVNVIRKFQHVPFTKKVGQTKLLSHVKTAEWTDKTATGNKKMTRAGNARQFCEKCHVLNSHQCFASYKHDTDTNKKKAKEIFSRRDLTVIENSRWDCANYSQCINKLFNTKAKHLPCKNCSDYIKKALDVMDYVRYNSSATATGAFCFTSSRKPKAR